MSHAVISWSKQQRYNHLLIVERFAPFQSQNVNKQCQPILAIINNY